MKKALSIGLLIWAAVFGAVGCAGSAGKLPSGVVVGELSGPGGEQFRRALKKRAVSGPEKLVLSGQISLSRQLSAERETVPREVAAGPPQIVYKPDPFTARVWSVEETPMTTELGRYDFQRLSGRLVFDWRLTDLSGRPAAGGRLAVDIDRTRGGYLAFRGLAPPLADSRTPGSSPAGPDFIPEGRLADRLAEELARLLALELGRDPGALELESGDDSLSRRAKSLAASGQWDEAVKLWRELLRQNPRYAPALYDLGLYWERRQDPEEAWRYYRAAFLSEGSRRHRRALTRLTETLRHAGRLPQRGSEPTK